MTDMAENYEVINPNKDIFKKSLSYPLERYRRFFDIVEKFEVKLSRDSIYSFRYVLYQSYLWGREREIDPEKYCSMKDKLTDKLNDDQIRTLERFLCISRNLGNIVSRCSEDSLSIDKSVKNYFFN